MAKACAYLCRQCCFIDGFGEFGEFGEFLGSYSEGAGSSQRELLGSWGSYSGPPWGVSIQGAYNGSLEAPTMLEVPKKLT